MLGSSLLYRMNVSSKRTTFAVVPNIKVGLVCVGWSQPPHTFLLIFLALSRGIKLQEGGVNVGRPGTYAGGGLDSFTMDHTVTLPLPWTQVFVPMS